MSSIIVNIMYLIYIVFMIYMQGFCKLIASVPSLDHSPNKKARQNGLTVGSGVGLSG